MNRCYRIIWNYSRSLFVVVSELARSRTRTGSSLNGLSSTVSAPLRRFQPNALARAIALLCGTALFSLSGIVSAQEQLPTGGQIVAGSGQINQDANTLTVQQNSDKLITNWQSFNIGSQNSVTFQQPSVDAVALNRILGSNASEIYGSLTANGQVFLVNPNGILFAEGASVDVGSLVASTLDISNENFLQGNYVFEGDANSGSIRNQGTLRAAEGGAVALLGAQVRNDGLIAARLGTAALAAGEQITLDFAGDGLLQVSVDRGAFDALVANNQLIKADGGVVLMTAKASNALLQTVVNNSGVVEAHTVAERDGKILLLGGFNGGTVEVAGTLDASAPNGGDAGFIETSGARVDFSGATILASSKDGRSGSWLIDPEDVVIDESNAQVIETSLNANLDVTIQTGVPGEGDSAPNERGNITVDAPILVSKSPAQFSYEVERTLTARGDVLPGIETEALAEGVSVVYLDRYEINEVGDENLVAKTLTERGAADAALVAGDSIDPRFSKYEISELPAGVDVVNVVSRDVGNVATLSLISGKGNVTVNAPIRSINGIVNIVMRAGAEAGAHARDESVFINADLLTNGGDIAVQANHEINVANGVTLSTRDIFGINRSETRVVGTEVGQIDPSRFIQASQISAYTTGESGNIVLMTDKYANGFSNFVFFYRSDIVGINIGDDAALLAQSDEARDGSIRVLAVSKIGDLFEGINWLAVRNFTASEINVGKNAKLMGGAIDVIADASSEADVGNLVESFVTNLVSDGIEAAAPVITINEEDAAPSQAEKAYNAFTSIELDPFAVNDAATQASQDNASELDLPGYELGVQNTPKIATLAGKAVGTGISKLVSNIPVIGDILTLSPFAIAIAESQSTVKIGEGALISGTDVVTVHSNSTAKTMADAKFPGLAFSLTVNNSNSILEIDSGAKIISTAQDRQEPTSQLLHDQDFLRFGNPDVISFGVNRDFLNPAKRGSLAALDVAAVSNSTSTIKVVAATLALSAQQKVADDAAIARAKKDGVAEAPAEKSAIDSPVDISLGIMIGDNASTLTVAKDAEIISTAGNVDLRSEAHVLKANNSVTGGKLQTPSIQCTEDVSDKCHSTKEYDASDIVNMAIAIGSTTNYATSNIDGIIQGKSVEISTLAETHKYSNGAVSEQGYDNDFDAGAATHSKLASKNDPSKAQQAQNSIKGLVTDLAAKIKGKTGTDSSTKVKLIEEGPENQLFGLAGGVTVSVINQAATSNIGANAALQSDGGTLDVSTLSHSGVINNFAKTGVQNGRTNAVAASVALGIYNFNADTMVADGASFRALNPVVSSEDLELGRYSAITVSSQSYIDSPFLESKYQKATYATDMKASKLLRPDTAVKALKGFTTGAPKNDIVDYARSRVNDLLDNGQLLTTNWASSYYINASSPAYQGTGTYLGTEKDNPPTEDLNANTDYSSDVSVAGAFGLLTTDNNASTTIGNASFEVINGNADNANDITIAAETWSHTVMAGGNIAPPDPNTDNPLETFAPGDRAGKGVGGSLNIQEGSSTVNVDIKDGASFDTALGTMSAFANNHRETQVVQVSGGMAASIGVNGAFGINVFDDKVSARVADGAFINAKAVSVSSSITQPGIFNLSGGFAVGGAVGVGVGVGINIVNRDSDAVLGFVGTGDQAAAGGQVNVDDLSVTADQVGFITNIDVAGGIQAPESKAPPVEGGAGTTAESETNPDDKEKSSGGVGISGSVAINISNASTQAKASLSDGSTIENTVTVRADDAVDLTGLSGAAGITVNGGVAVAGAASINTVQSDNDAILETMQGDSHFNTNGAAYTPYDVDVSAMNTGKIQAVALGIAVVAGVPSDDGGKAKVSAAAAGSFTYNSVRNDAFADIRNSRLVLDAAPIADPDDDDDEPGITVIANDGAQIISVAGAIAVSAGKENNAAAVGGSVAINTIQNRTDAQIDNSNITDADLSDDTKIIVGASHIAPIYSFAIAGAAGTSKLALAGSAVINTINTEDNMGTFAGIKNSNITSDGDVSVYTGDEAQIISLGGAVAGTSGNAAVGGAFVWNEIGGSISSTVTGSTINAEDGINVLAITESPNAVPDTPFPTLDELKESAMTVGKDVATVVGRGAIGAISLRDKNNTPTIAPVDSNDLVEGSNGIYSAAVAGGGAKDVAVFGSFAVNSLHKTVAATVSNSTMQSSGDILMSAQADAVIRSLAGSVAVSLGAAGVGGAGTYNTIRDKSLVTLENSDISADNVLANAGRSGSVKTLGAAAGIASTAGVQGSTAITTLAGQTATAVQGGTITAQNRAVIGADSSVDTVTTAGGVAGGGTVAVGASLALTVSEDTTSSTVGTTTASSVNAKSAVDIKAESIDQHDTAVMTGSLGVGAAGVAGSVGIKVIDTQTSAAVGANSKINTLSGYNGAINVLSDASLALTGASGAVGGGAYAGVGAGLDLTVVNSVSSATVGDGAVLHGLDISIQALNQRDISSMTVAGGGGLVGVAGAVSVIHVGGGDLADQGSQALGQSDYEDSEGNTKREENVMSYAQGLVNTEFTSAQVSQVVSAPAQGDTVAYVGSATLQATRDISIDAQAKHDVDVNSGALGAGAVGAGAGVVSVTYNSKTSAISQSAMLSAGDDVGVKAVDKDESTHTAWWLEQYEGSGQRALEVNLTDGDDFGVQAFAGSAGIAALGAAVAVIDRDNDTSAEIRGGSTMAVDRVDVLAQRDRYNRSASLGAQVGAVTVGASISNVSNDGQVLASAGGTIGSEGNEGSVLSVEATGDNKNDVMAIAAAGGVVTATGAVATINGASLDLDARIADDATINLKQSNVIGESVLDANTGRVDMTASGINADRAFADGNSIGIGVGAGAIETRVATSSEADVVVGDDAALEVQGLLTLSANVRGAELGSNNIYSPNNSAESRGVAAGLIAGVASSVAISEQDVSSGVSIGENASINAGRITLDSEALGGTRARATGGAFAGLAGVNSINAFDLDHYNSNVSLGAGADLVANTIELFSDSLNLPSVSTAAISGGLANATLSQFSNTQNHAKTRKLSSNSTISVADGASTDSVNNTTLSSTSFFSGYTQGNGSAGGASSITVVNSDFHVQQDASISIGDASIRSGRVLTMESNTNHNLVTQFDAAAFGAGAGATIKLDANVSGTAKLDLEDGAEIAGDEVILQAKDQQTNHKLNGTAEIGAAVGAADTFVSSTVNMAQTINVKEGAEVRASKISINANEGASNRSETIDITQKNSSLTFFLEADKQVIAHNYTPSVLLNGDLYSSAAGNGTLKIAHQYNGLLVNGRNALFEPVSYATLEGNTLHINDLMPEAGKGNIAINAGVGNVTGTGQVVNSGGFFDAIEITGTGSVEIDGLSMLGSAGDAPSVSVISGNNYTPTVVGAKGSAPTLTVEAAGDIRLTGDIDVGDGAVSLLAMGTLVNSSGDISQSESTLLRTGMLDVRAENGSVGTQENPLTVRFVDKESKSNASLTGVAIGDGLRGDFYLDASLEGNDATLNIGDIQARDSIGLTLGSLLTGGAANYVLASGNSISTLGQLDITATATGVSFTIDGIVRSGFDSAVSTIDIEIDSNGELSNQWPGLTATLVESDDERSIILGNIGRESGGVNIVATSLNGSGTITGNSGGLDINIVNNDRNLAALYMRGINIESSATPVTINGNSSASSVGGITIQRVSNTGNNDIHIDSQYTREFVLLGDIRSTGKLTLDLGTVERVHRANSELDPILQAQTLEINAASALTVGYGSNPLKLDVGSGGLKVSAAGAINLREVSGDLLINEIVNYPLPETSLVSVNIVVEDGSLLAKDNALIVSKEVDFTASADIDLSNTALVVDASIDLDGTNVSVFGDSLALGTVKASGNFTATAAEAITGVSVQVVGDTSLRAANIVLNSPFNDFTGKVNYTRTGASDNALALFDQNDLILGDINAATYDDGEGDATQLLITANGDITQAEDSFIFTERNITLSAGNDIVLTNADNWFDEGYLNVVTARDVSIATNQTAGIDLGVLTLSRNLDVNAIAGPITQSGQLNIGGDSSFRSTDNLTLLNGNNQFTGAVSMDITGDVKLASNASIDFGDVAIFGFATLSSGQGNLTDSGTISFGKDALLQAPNGNIVFDTSTNELGKVGGTAVNVTLVDGSSLFGIYPFDITGKLTLVGNSIDFLPRLSATHLNAGLYAASNTLGALDITSRVSAVNFPNPSNPSESFVVTGDVNITAENTVLNNTDFRGAIGFHGSASAQAQITNNAADGSVILGDSNVGTLLVNVPFGAVTQKEDTAIVASIAEFRAEGDITLDGAENDFDQLNILNGLAVTIRDKDDLRIRADGTGIGEYSVSSLDVTAGDIRLGQANATLIDSELSAESIVRVVNDLRLTATAGSIGDDTNILNVPSHGFQIGGNSYFTASGDIYINNLENSFAQAINIDAGGDAAVQLTFAANNGRETGLQLEFGDIRTGNDFTTRGVSIEIGSMDIGGNLSLSTNLWSDDNSIEGSISSHGPVIVGGTTTINAIGDVTFDNASNAFAGAISISDRTESTYRGQPNGFPLALPSINVDLAASSLMTLGTINMPKRTGFSAGLLQVSAAAGITQIAPLTLDGAISFAASNGAITLEHADNDFGGTVNAEGLSISLNDQNALSLGQVATTGGDLNVIAGSLTATQTLNVSGNLDLRTTNGDLSTNELHVSGDAYFTAVDGTGLRDISITNANNQIDGSVGTDAHNFAIRTVGDLRGENLNISGILTATAQNIDVSSVGDLKLGLIDVLEGGGGDFVVSAKSVTLTEQVTVSGLASFTATDGDIVVDAGNDGIAADRANLYATGDIYQILEGAVSPAVSLEVEGVINVSGRDISLSLGAENPILGTVTTSGYLRLSSNLLNPDTLTQIAAFNIAGDLNINSKFKVVLNNPGNQLGGKLDIMRAGDVDIYVASDIELGEMRLYSGSSSNSSGNLTLASAGNITFDSDGYGYAEGWANISSDKDIVFVGGFIDSDATSLSAHNITLETTGKYDSLRLGDINATGNLSLRSGSINATGKVVVAGSTDLQVWEGNDLRMSNAENEFGGAILIIDAGNVRMESKYGFNFASISMKRWEEPDYGQGQGGNGNGNGNGNGGFDELEPAILQLHAHDGDIIVQGAVLTDSALLTLADGRNVVMDNVGNKFGLDSEFEASYYLPEFSAISEGSNGRLGSIRVTDSTDLVLILDEYLDESAATLDADGDIILRSLGSISLESFTEDDVNAYTFLRSAGNIVLAAGADFNNNSGLVDPLLAGGRWLVYSERPDHNTNDMAMDRDFLSFGKFYDPANPIPSTLDAGNALLFSIRPTLEGVSLDVNAQSIAYGENIDASVSAAELSDPVIGVSFDGDSIADPSIYGISLPAEISPEDLEVTVNEAVISRSNGGFINSGSYANGLLVAFKEGTGALDGLAISGSGQLSVAPRDLQVTSANVSKTYDGLLNAAGSAELASGFTLMTGDVLNGGSFAFSDANAGNNKVVSVSGVIVDDGFGGNNYNVSYLANTSSTISPATLQVTANNDSRVYNGEAYTGGNGVVYSGFVNGESEAVLTGALSFGGTSQGAKNAGSYTITPQGLEVGNYEFNYLDGTLDINTASLFLSVGADDKSKVYGDLDPIFTYQISDGELIGDDAFSGALARDAGENVGTYRIHQGSLSAGSNYSIDFTDGNLEITRRAITITSADLEKTYDGSTSAPATAVADNIREGDTLVGGSFAFLDPNAGLGKTVTVSDVVINDGNNGENYTFTYAPNVSSAINPARLTVTANDANRSYDGTEYSGGNGVVYSGFVNDESTDVLTGTIGYAGDAQGAVGAGTYAITPEGLSAANYVFDYVDGRLTIAQAGLSLGLAADDKTKIYGDADPIFTYQLTDGALIGDDSFSGNLGREAGEDAGDYAINLGTLSAGSNYYINFVDGTLTITPKEISVTSTSVTKTYDGTTSASGSLLLQSGSLVGSDTLGSGSFAFAHPNAGANRAVNVSDVIVNDGNNGNNYQVNYIANSSSTINPADLTVSAADVSRVYDGSAFTGGSEISYSGFVNGEGTEVLGGSISFAGNSQNAVGAGTYNISPSGLINGNYAINYVDGVLSIDPATLTVTANGASRTYDGTEYSGGNGVSYSGFVNDESDDVLTGTIGYTGDSQGAIAAGVYAITPEGLSAANYAISYVGGVLKILPVELSLLGVSADNKAKTYGDEDPIFTYQISEGALIEGDSLSGVLSRESGENVGDYAITQGTLDAGINYNLNFVDGVLSINPAALRISAVSTSTTYSGEAFTGGAGATYNGFVNGESASVLTGSLVYGGNSQGAIDAGDYTISLSGLNSANYAITYQDGALQILPVGLTLMSIGADDKTKTYGDADPEFTYQITDGALVDGDSLSGQLSRDLGENVGDYAITQGSLSAGGNYSLTFNNGVLRINARDISITSGAVVKTYDGTMVANASAILNSGSLASGDSLSGGSFAFADANAGSNKVITVSDVFVNDGNGGSNYSITYTAANSGVINPAALSVNAESTSKVYDGNAFTGGAGVRYVGFVNGETESVLDGSVVYGGSSQGAEDVGEYNISLSGLSSSNYAINYNDGALNIFPVGLTLLGFGADDKSKIYGDADPEFTYQIIEGALVEGDSISGQLTRDAGENVGNYSIRQGSLSAGENYSISFANGVLSINPRSITISSSDVFKTYDGNTSASAVAAISSGSLVAGDSLVGGSFAFLDPNAGSGKTVTVADVSIVDGNGGNNYNVSFANNSNNRIDPAALSIQAEDFERAYNGDGYSGGAGYSITGFVNGEGEEVLNGAVAYTGDSQGAVDAGSYSIVPTGVSAQNYTISVSPGLLTIVKANLALGVTADNQTKVYGDADPEFTYSISSGELLGSDSLSGSLAREEGDNVGSYAITPGSLSAGVNYLISVSGGSLTITPRAVTISSNDVVKVYDGTTDALASAVLSGGSLAAGDSVTGGSFSFVDANAGTGKTVTVSGVEISDGNGGANYTVSVAPNTNSIINKAIVTLTPTAQNKVYDGTVDSTGVVEVTGLVGADSIDNLTQAFDSADAGARTLVITGFDFGGAAQENYEVVRATATGVIEQALLTIGAQAQSKVFGAVFDFSGSEFSIVDGALQGSDQIVKVTLISDGVAADALPGTYSISIAGAEGAGLQNYQISYQDAAEGFTVEAPATELNDVLSTIVSNTGGTGAGGTAGNGGFGAGGVNTGFGGAGAGAGAGTGGGGIVNFAGTGFGTGGAGAGAGAAGGAGGAAGGGAAGAAGGALGGAGGAAGLGDGGDTGNAGDTSTDGDDAGGNDDDEDDEDN